MIQQQKLAKPTSPIQTILSNYAHKTAPHTRTPEPFSTQLRSKFGNIRTLATNLSQQLDASASAIRRQAQTLPSPTEIHLLPLCQHLGDLPECTAILGHDSQARPFLLGLSDPSSAHVLVQGLSPGQKILLMRVLIASLAMRNQQNQLQC